MWKKIPYYAEYVYSIYVEYCQEPRDALYTWEELVHTNSNWLCIRTWPATGFCIYRSPDSFPLAHSETAFPQCPSGDTFLISNAGGALGAAWLPDFLIYCQAYFSCYLHFNSLAENFIPEKENCKLYFIRKFISVWRLIGLYMVQGVGNFFFS